MLPLLSSNPEGSFLLGDREGSVILASVGPRCLLLSTLKLRHRIFSIVFPHLDSRFELVG